jgi:hypothetical protein
MKNYVEIVKVLAADERVDLDAIDELGQSAEDHAR